MTLFLEIQLLIDMMFEHIKKTKYKIINLNDVSEILKEKLGEDYNSEIGISVKSALREHDSLDFFKEGDYISNQKFHYCAGNWLAIKGVYENPIEAKDKMGWYSWQETAEIDWDSLD